MNESRTKNVAKNSTLGMISQIVNLFLSFIAQTILIKTMGSQYVGINGLFTNILTVLSFAELGIGNAIIYSMYKPIANADNEKIKSLMSLYKKCYHIIGIVIFVLGLCVTPFIQFIIKDIPDIRENINIIYILFLLNTVLSYFFTYKKSIIIAHQKEYIVNLNRLLFNVIKTLLQITFLLLTHNYILYLLILIITGFIENLCISIKSNKMYPELSEGEPQQLEKSEKKNIFTNVKSLVIYKFGSVVLNGTDNIILSSMVGVSAVGICSNYTLVINAINTIINQILNGFTASVGNLNAIGTKEKKEEILYELLFISFWIYGFLTISLFLLINEFIDIWLGNKYILETNIVLALVLHFFINGMQFAAYTYRTTMGLFVKGKKAPIIAAIINVILSIILCYKCGIAGIFFATSISRILTTTWYDPVIIYKNEFHKSPIIYLKKYIFYIFILVVNFMACQLVLNLINISGIGGFIIKGIVCTLLSNIIFTLLLYRTKEFKGTISYLNNLIRRN